METCSALSERRCKARALEHSTPGAFSQPNKMASLLPPPSASELSRTWRFALRQLVDQHVSKQGDAPQAACKEGRRPGCEHSA